MRILISTGEVSGDVVGALLTRAIRAQRPDTSVLGIGGPRMEAAGALVRFKSSHLGTVGVTEAIATLPGFVRASAVLRAIVREERPDIAVLIGNDLFHVLLGRWLRWRGVRTVAYFPPQTWVWRSLARPIARSFDAVLTSFPDEQEVYSRASRGADVTDVTFVGHYLADVLAWRTPASIRAARERLGLAVGARVVGLMPGSRRHEVRRLLPVLMGAARLLLDADATLRFLVPLAEERYRAEIEREIARVGIGDRVTLLSGPSHDVMIAADLLILASGTASLEATLLGVPMVILYNVSALTYGVIRACIRSRLIDSDVVGLPNLILGRRAIPELIQDRVEPRTVAAAATAVLTSPGREGEIREALAEAARRVSGGGTLARAASYVIAMAEPSGAGAPERVAVEGAGIAARSGLDAPVPESK